MIYSLSTSHEQDGDAADDRQDHSDDHQNRLRQLGVAALIGCFFARLQSLDAAALAVVTLHASERKEMRGVTFMSRCGFNTYNIQLLYSHADGLLQPLDVFAVAVDAVAQVGGGAGIVGGAQSGRVAAGGAEGVLRVQRSGVPTPVLAFALLLLPLRSAGVHTCLSRGGERKF